jgi:hypothetical protein
MPPQDTALELAFAEELFRRFNITPENIKSRDRPDLSFEVDGVEVGMEITHMTYEEYIRGSRLHQDLLPGEAVVVSNLRNHGERRGKEELISDMMGITNTEWDSFDDIHREWVEQLARTVESKRKKFRSSTFNKFSKNWLLVKDTPGLDNTVPTAIWFAENGGKFTFAMPTGDEDFDAIFVVSGDYTFRFTKEGINIRHPRADAMNATVQGKG